MCLAVFKQEQDTNALGKILIKQVGKGSEVHQYDSKRFIGIFEIWRNGWSAVT